MCVMCVVFVGASLASFLATGTYEKDSLSHDGSMGFM